MKRRSSSGQRSDGGASPPTRPLLAGWRRSPTLRTGSARETWPSGPTTSAARSAVPVSGVAP
eukprot:11194150-Alexandrium_andersonii.AAC.1